jgi:hypothetical protein
LFTYRIASTARRRSWIRGRPPTRGARTLLLYQSFRVASLPVAQIARIAIVSSIACPLYLND